MNSAGVVREPRENVAKICLFTERSEQRLDGYRPPTEGQLRFVNQPPESPHRLVGTGLDDVHERFGHSRFSRATTSSKRFDGLAGVLEGGAGASIVARQRQRRS